jgi:hypothetical protein
MIRLVLAAAIALALSRPADARRLPWCGFYMMQLKHKTDRRLARAIEWARGHRCITENNLLEHCRCVHLCTVPPVRAGLCSNRRLAIAQ